MSEWCPDAKIISLEHDLYYYEKAISKLSKFADIIYVPLEDSKYSNWPIFHKEKDFDLIFVDGRERIECLKTASKIISSNGIILLHDSNRPKYKPGINYLKNLGFIIKKEFRTTYFYKRK
jgi:tRNA A58 N-methylase Trm61